MSKPYLMPSLGAGMEAGTVIEWHVEPGQEVQRGQVVGVVDTEKGAIEIEIWEDAQVMEIVAPPGAKVPVGEPLLLLGEAGGEGGEKGGTEGGGRPEEEEAPPDPAEGAPPETEILEEVWEVDAEAPPEAPGPETQPVPDEPGRRLRVSPVARRRARDLGVDLGAVQGTGPGGAITLKDVEGWAGDSDGEAAAAEGGRHAPLRHGADRPGEDRHTAMRNAIAAAMTRSKREIPHYYLAHTTPVEAALQWLEATNRDRPPARRILLAALYLKAVATALGEFPEFNGFWEDDGFRPAEGIHPGVAISLRGGGLVAPAIHHVDTLSLDDVTAAIRDVVQRSRSGHLRGSEVADPTITVTSLGDRGVDQVFGVIYPPQVAIVGIGKVVERPWAEGGMVGSRRVIHLTLAADHRASDGHRGGLFLAGVARRLQIPEEL